MSGRIDLLPAAVVFAVAASCGAGIVALGGSTGCGAPVNTAVGTGPTGAAQAVLHTPHGDWAADQVGHAAAIVHIGQTLGVPVRGSGIAVGTAMQESRLHNLPGGDLDSIGPFQQRPSQGWGTPDQLSDPAYTAGAFYHRLPSIPGWQTMPLADAAQAVQHGAIPTPTRAGKPTPPPSSTS